MRALAPTSTTSSRAELSRVLDDAVARIEADRVVLLLALDLDDFRGYNAEHGYDAGDALLARVAGRLAHAHGGSFPLGADAFTLVVEGTPEELWLRGAAALWSLVRHDDALFRMGGDELALLLEHCAPDRALEIVDRVHERLAEESRDGDPPLGASFGVAVAECSGPIDCDELLRRADDAMYRAKGARTSLRVAA